MVWGDLPGPSWHLRQAEEIRSKASQTPNYSRRDAASDGASIPASKMCTFFLPFSSHRGNKAFPVGTSGSERREGDAFTITIKWTAFSKSTGMIMCIFQEAFTDIFEDAGLWASHPRHYPSLREAHRGVGARVLRRALFTWQNAWNAPRRTTFVCFEEAASACLPLRNPFFSMKGF